MDLRHELISLGYNHWRGQSDTEVILNAYAQWGLEGLKKLEGIFSLALWDSAQQRLILMRDRLGIKPLFYGKCKYGLAFGSEIKAVLASGGVDTSLDEQAFSEYLWYGNSYGERTFYKGVHALKPGHWLIFENGSQFIDKWWSVEDWLEDHPFSCDASEAALLTRDAVDAAVNRQLVADVPIGLFLSGGVDSSTIAASAIHSGSVPLQSFAAGFDYEYGVNELPKAAQVASYLGLNHQELVISGTDLRSVLYRLADAHDEPFADAANIPLFLMCDQLQSKVKVVLQGDGGDELFAGYRRYSLLRNSKFWRLFPKILAKSFRSFSSSGRRLARIAETVGHHDPSYRMAFLLTVETQYSPPDRLFCSDFQQHLCENTNPFQEYQNAAKRFAHFDPVSQMMLTDLVLQLPSQFLTKVDRAFMAASVEARVPLLDEGVLRLALNLPSHLKVSRFGKKLPLRGSQRNRLPSQILDGPKTGFGVPYSQWLRTSLFDFCCEHILDPSFTSRFSLDESLVEDLLQDHKRAPGGNGFLLWKLLQLSLWSSLKR
ncbi:asparagine synthase (glutamine-hydrolyzing) [Synechococcus sp. MVIR-18-1]|uniref:asparagine synthase (glutamine-hydrolyzing) n=1 Tax=Synechococcus sp. MVIR-18-1 TaxID=1386941 RepID=UPI0016468CE4|nr:asparagine synthase (glutamine-hydrolyzing) [Synechococcus sp. MVIR-18-1]QNI75239.1 asparagine synthase (glutamine-hydrolyzing) [Synechococcus sp. MVIR-18-1]